MYIRVKKQEFNDLIKELTMFDIPHLNNRNVKIVACNDDRLHIQVKGTADIRLINLLTGVLPLVLDRFSVEYPHCESILHDVVIPNNPFMIRTLEKV